LSPSSSVASLLRTRLLGRRSMVVDDPPPLGFLHHDEGEEAGGGVLPFPFNLPVTADERAVGAEQFDVQVAAGEVPHALWVLLILFPIPLDGRVPALPLLGAEKR